MCFFFLDNQSNQGETMARGCKDTCTKSNEGNVSSFIYVASSRVLPVAMVLPIILKLTDILVNTYRMMAKTDW